MELLHEAGPFGYLVVILFLTGLAAAVKTRSPQAVAPFLFAVVGAGQLGQGLGQHAVRRAIEGVDNIADKVLLLNAGTGEAASCLVLSGACALLLCAVTGALALVKRES